MCVKLLGTLYIHTWPCNFQYYPQCILHVLPNLGPSQGDSILMIPPNTNSQVHHLMVPFFHIVILMMIGLSTQIFVDIFDTCTLTNWMNSTNIGCLQRKKSLLANIIIFFLCSLALLGKWRFLTITNVPHVSSTYR